MVRVCLTSKGKLIEMQRGGDDRPDLMEMRLNTLKQNALNAGYKEDEIEVKWVTDEEYAAILEANKPIPTYIELRHKEYATTEDQLDSIMETLKYMKDAGINIGPMGTKYVNDCTAIKEKYPKLKK